MIGWTSVKEVVSGNLSMLAWGPVVIFVFGKVICIAPITGRSMQPTLNPDTSGLRNDIVLVDRDPKWNPRSLKRGDIVLFNPPHSPDIITIKRILALEGDTVTPLQTYPDKRVKIPKGHIWVEGDEAFHTKDSNMYGPISLGLVTGKATHIIWPYWRIGRLHSHLLSSQEKRVIPATALVTS